MEQEKIAAVQDWKTPTNVKGVESFLGFANFYQHFIKEFSNIAGPLNALKGKKEWKWEKEEQDIFNMLKKKIINPSIPCTTTFALGCTIIRFEK
ncbi:Protein NYNRIN [Leucoagaricus sp. SymC.cos]|nr:Protein NYNRIN [Leucoagaricus sp. SymC.cos]